MRQQHHELLPAEARNHVRGSQGLAHHARQVNQRAVTRLVAEAVIQLLEIVQIENGQTQR